MKAQKNKRYRPNRRKNEYFTKTGANFTVTVHSASQASNLKAGVTSSSSHSTSTDSSRRSVNICYDFTMREARSCFCYVSDNGWSMNTTILNSGFNSKPWSLVMQLSN